MELKQDVVVHRAPAGSPAEFVAECADLEIKAFGPSKDAAVDACEKAILGKLLAAKTPAPVVEVKAPAADAPTEPPPMKKAPAKG